jgi:hypothetical protein
LIRSQIAGISTTLNFAHHDLSMRSSPLSMFHRRAYPVQRWLGGTDASDILAPDLINPKITRC